MPSPKVLTSLIPLDKTIKCSVGDNRRKPSSHLSSKGFVFEKKSFGIILMTNDNILSPINFYGTRATLIATFSPFSPFSLSSFAFGPPRDSRSRKDLQIFSISWPEPKEKQKPHCQNMLIAEICACAKEFACLMAANRRCGLRLV